MSQACQCVGLGAGVFEFTYLSELPSRGECGLGALFLMYLLLTCRELLKGDQVSLSPAAANTNGVALETVFSLCHRQYQTWCAVSSSPLK